MGGTAEGGGGVPGAGWASTGGSGGGAGGWPCVAGTIGGGLNSVCARHTEAANSAAMKIKWFNRMVSSLSGRLLRPNTRGHR